MLVVFKVGCCKCVLVGVVRSTVTGLLESRRHGVLVKTINSQDESRDSDEFIERRR